MQITVQMTATQLALIDRAGEALGLSRSAYLRMRALSSVLGHNEAELQEIRDRGPQGPIVALPAPEPARESKGTAAEPPAGYHLVTIMEQDLGKDAWMSPADAGIG